ncbi:GOLPH3/VPS74 family protein [Streptomyces bungoensis]|uniref:GOLPH3/VPS74 family protein n=1 Tax=Streptomyces bungoensis TaxID=285568 RepID=UPI000A861EB6|nr:GPP34 family phosphoprotein [Streptomyces bungoensis]
MSTSLADEVALHVAAATGGRTASWRVELGCALAGAVLLDLALAGRVVVRPGQLLINRPGPLADPVQDEVLRRLAARWRAGSAEEWIERLAPLVRDRVLDGLVARGLLFPEPGRWTVRLHPGAEREPVDPARSETVSRLLYAAHRRWAPTGRAARADEPEAVTAVCAAVASCVLAAARRLMCGY